MTHTPNAAAQATAEAIAADLLRLEQAVSQALSLAHSMGQTMIEGQAAARISPTFGQAVYEDLAAVLATTTGLRGQVGAMHNRMHRHAERLNIAVTAGGMEKPPKEGGNETPWPRMARLQPSA